ncbi:MAG: FAD binding domain-containing protein [Lacisediminihabitans sp.]
MDLITVREIRVPHTRDELSFAPGERPLAGGTWLYSERQDGLTGLVDLTGLGWQSITETESALSIAATCTLAELSRLSARDGWNAHPLLWQCCTSLLGSFKIWNLATVGGNICLSLPAGPMTSLAASLDASALIWMVGGGERSVPVAEFVTGVRTNQLMPGEVLRSVQIPLEALAARTGFRRIALSPLGRSGALAIARRDASGETVFTITAGTHRPRQLRFDEIPSARALESAVLTIDDWYEDAHGAADWRRAMSVLFAEELRVELSGAA